MSVGEKLEAAISQLTQPVGGQYPRPWMTDLQDPMKASVFIVGMNQAKGYPVARVGSHARHVDALYNRNGQGCRALYDEMTDGKASPTRINVDDLTRRLTHAGVEGVLETNVICYSTPMSRDLHREEHAAGAAMGDLIFRTLLAHIRPAVLIAHGAGAAKQLGKCLGSKLPSPPERADDIRSINVDYNSHTTTVLVVPSLAPPQWNSWKFWAADHLDLVAKAAATYTR
ncbi:uracil-DNA glycosylase family protein [Ralstonia mannitolilytica]|uniref:uracil-DNA glycosylase family protein n=1 Tax=Ralstonia mannitolilytica TaxID=105219 RepID=UPI001C9786DD|nr:uracil-DNA glycosylase family protein [Ralstonia mannitolilytica]MBY4721469.1 uracil-DNA glycosylase family protein [Ralstonia mannitolilytica]